MRRIWDARQVGTFLRLSAETVRHGGAGTGEIPRIKMGRAVRWDADDVERWIERQHQKSVARIDRRFGRRAS